MYGTVARARVKQGRFEDVVSLMDEWNRDFKPKVDGAVGGILYRLDKDPSEVVMCAVFRDKESYFANAGNPDQDKWFQRLRECFEGDPEWNDGEAISHDF